MVGPQMVGLRHHWLDWHRKRFWAVLALLVYTLAGFLIAPPLLRRELLAQIQNRLDRPATLAGVRVNPWALSVELRGFDLREKDGAPLLAFDRFYVRAAPSALFHWAWGLADVRLEGLKATLVRTVVPASEPDTNIGRLIAQLSAAPPGAPAAPIVADQAGADGADGGLPRLLVRHLLVADASLTVDDRVPATAFKTTIGPASIEFTELSTLRDREGQQHVLVGLEGGATLDWGGKTGLNPLNAQGHVAARGAYPPLVARYFGRAFGVAVPTGTLALDLDYSLTQRDDGRLALGVEHLGLSLANLTVAAAGDPAPLLTLPELRLDGGHLAWPDRVVGAEALMLDAPSLTLRRRPDGGLDLPMPPPGAQAREAGAPAPPTEDGPAWTASLGRLVVRKASVRLDDGGVPGHGRAPGAAAHPPRIDVRPIDLTVDGLSSAPGASFPVTLAVGLAAGGGLKAQGRLGLLPQPTLTAKVALNDLALVAAQPYLRDSVRLTIDDGRLDGGIDLTWSAAAGLSATGHGAVSALTLRDDGASTPVLSWERLGVDRFEYRQAAGELRVSQVAVKAPYLRFQVAADQTTNFSHITTAPPAAAPTPHGPPPPPAPAPLKISVGRITVAGGAADYGDASLPLPFAAHITALGGEVSALTSVGASPTRLALRGQVGDYGQLRVDGHLTPFEAERDTNVALQFRNIEFPGLSPYTVKFAGRRIAGGRLDVDLRYVIAASKLHGANRVVIRDIRLGEKQEVPGAMNLPLELAIALLKDEQGRINVDLPVSGDLNNPQFDIGAVISQSVSTLLGNLVTAPFRALAALFGGDDGDALDHIDFSPGSADLAPPEREKILHLADALRQRPQLALVVPGVIDPQADGAQLRHEALDARMVQALGDQYTVDRQRRFLEELYTRRLGPQAEDGPDTLASLRRAFTRPVSKGQTTRGEGELDEPGYLGALRDRVAESEPIADDSLNALGRARAQAVATALAASPGFEPRRVTLRDTATTRMGDDGVIALKLDAASF